MKIQDVILDPRVFSHTLSTPDISPVSLHSQMSLKSQFHSPFHLTNNKILMIVLSSGTIIGLKSWNQFLTMVLTQEEIELLLRELTSNLSLMRVLTIQMIPSVNLKVLEKLEPTLLIPQKCTARHLQILFWIILWSKSL